MSLVIDPRPDTFTPVSRSTPPAPSAAPAPASVRKWVAELSERCRPDWIVWCDGSDAQHRQLSQRAVEQGVLVPLRQDKWPGCFAHRARTADLDADHAPDGSTSADRATAIDRFLCTADADGVGPTNRWMHESVAHGTLNDLFEDCMKGRTMYVVPFVLGPVGSTVTRVGVQITDSIFVALAMRTLTRVGPAAWDAMSEEEDFIRIVHGVGDVTRGRRIVCHFPQENAVWSYGSESGAAALLARAAVALTLAGHAMRLRGGLAERMAVLGVESPDGKKTYVAAAFPENCGRTTLALLAPPPHLKAEGWRVTTVSEDAAWLWPADGRLRAVNPHAGLCGRLTGVNENTAPNVMATLAHDTIFTGVAVQPDGDIWWEGKTDTAPDVDGPAAHAAARFFAPATNNPVRDAAADDPAGVPIAAICFGARRSGTVPLVAQAFDWLHGVFLGATLGTEVDGVVRRKPMALLPRLGYNVRDYLNHWVRLRKKLTDCPAVFLVNFFHTDDDGEVIWPGFGENMRVLRWIADRCNGRAAGRETPVGMMPVNLDVAGLNLTPDDVDRLQHVDADEYRREVLGHEELFLTLGGELPREIALQRELLISRL